MLSEASPANARMPIAAQPIPAARMAAAPGPLGVLSMSCDTLILLLPMHENNDASAANGRVFVQESAEGAGNCRSQECRNGEAQYTNAHVPVLNDRAFISPSNIGHHGHSDRRQPRNVLFPFHSDVVPFGGLAGR